MKYSKDLPPTAEENREFMEQYCRVSAMITKLSETKKEMEKSGFKLELADKGMFVFGDYTIEGTMSKGRETFDKKAYMAETAVDLSPWMKRGAPFVTVKVREAAK